jgi:predicted Fe-Mo cluster-binding NifX family protein
MNIAVSAKSDNIKAEIDPRFGRCSYFLIINCKTMEHKVISNENVMASGGAGIQAAQTIAKSGVEAVLTGNIGPNAFQTLSAAGIRVYTGASGIVKDAVESYKKGEFKETEAPNVGAHSGMRR